MSFDEQKSPRYSERLLSKRKAILETSNQDSFDSKRVKLTPHKNQIGQVETFSNEIPSTGVKLPEKSNGDIKLPTCNVNNIKIHPFFTLEKPSPQSIIPLQENIYALKEGEEIPFFFKSADQKKEYLLKKKVEELQQDLVKRSNEKPTGEYNLSHFKKLKSPKVLAKAKTEEPDLDIVAPYYPEITHCGFSTLEWSPISESDRIFKVMESDTNDEPIDLCNIVYYDQCIGLIKANAEAIKSLKLSQDVKENTSSLPWTSKYFPTSHKHVFGNYEWTSFMFTWLSKWKRALQFSSRLREYFDTNIQSTLLLCGPCGIGKTSSIYSCCNELGFSIIEINPSTQRSGSHIKDLFSEAMQSHRVKHGENDNSLILFEEIDIVFPQDRGFYNSLFDFIETSKRPIVLTCNKLPNPVYQKLMRSKKVLEIPFNIPPEQVYTSLYQNLLYVEGIPQLVDTQRILSVPFHQDIRFSINNIQMWFQPLRILLQDYPEWVRSIIPIEGAILFKDFEGIRQELQKCATQNPEKFGDHVFFKKRLCDIMSSVLEHESYETIYRIFGIHSSPTINQEASKQISKETLAKERNELYDYGNLINGLSSVDTFSNSLPKSLNLNHLFEMKSNYIVEVYAHSIAKYTCEEYSAPPDNYDFLVSKKNIHKKEEQKKTLNRVFDISPVSIRSRKVVFEKDIFPFIKLLARLESERKRLNSKRRYTNLVNWKSYNITEEMFDRLLCTSDFFI